MAPEDVKVEESNPENLEGQENDEKKPENIEETVESTAQKKKKKKKKKKGAFNLPLLFAP